MSYRDDNSNFKEFSIEKITQTPNNCVIKKLLEVAREELKKPPYLKTETQIIISKWPTIRVRSPICR